jgi:hypothetical protein
MWGIWDNENKDWVKESRHTGYSFYETDAVLAFKSKRAACNRAANRFGFDSYTDAKRRGWCEVRKLP